MPSTLARPSPPSLLPTRPPPPALNSIPLALPLSNLAAGPQLVTTSLPGFMSKLKRLRLAASGADTCFVTHTSRSDIIQALLGHRAMYDSLERQTKEPPFAGGLILTGSSLHDPLDDFAHDYIKLAKMPVLRSNLSTAHTLQAVKAITPKMRATDGERVRSIIDLYAPHLRDGLQRLVGGSASEAVHRQTHGRAQAPAHAPDPMPGDAGATAPAMTPAQGRAVQTSLSAG